MPERLVIFVEGKGDVKALPVLARRVIDELDASDTYFVDFEPFRVRSVATLVKNGCRDWRRWLETAAKTRNALGAVLLALDGDIDHVPRTWTSYTDRYQSTQFCAYKVAAVLGRESTAVRAGDRFSLSTVFAMKEFESWLLAGIESLRGKALAEGRGMVPINAERPNTALEDIRDAKGRLKEIIPAYSQTLDQAVLAREVDLKLVRNNCRSFRRFCSAIQQMVEAARRGTRVVTPTIEGD